MTTMTATSDYLDRLDVALRHVPHGVAAEIRAGIAEELSSLGPDAAEQRIAQLGDPAVIAREAVDAGGYLLPSAVALAGAPAPVSVTRSRGFAIAAALTLSFGGFLVPFVGWVVGAVTVAMSGMWRSWEKVVAICVPLVLSGIVMLISFASFTTSAVEVHEAAGTGDSPEIANPLVPIVYDFGHSAIIVLVLVAVPASGLWLLWRMRGRTTAS